MLTISERRRLHEMNGVVAKVKRTSPRIYPAPPGPVDSVRAASLPQSTAGAISPDDPLRPMRGIFFASLISGVLFWMPAGYWFWSRFLTP